jgi:lysophospholipase L1-like esterase
MVRPHQPGEANFRSILTVDARAIVAFGDSITDGTASTMNGDDRWPDVLARRLHAVYGTKIAVVNAGIGGNQIVGPAEYTPQKPFPGGPSAKDRLDRDMLSLSGIAAVVWLEGINDFSKNGNAIRAARGARGRSDSVPRPQLPIACFRPPRLRHPLCPQGERGAASWRPSPR